MRGARSRILRFARMHRGEWNDPRELAQAVLGLVVGAAVMAAASVEDRLGQVIIAVVVSLIVYWAAERYAQILAAGVQGARPSWAGIREALRGGWPMVEASYAPILVLVVATLLSRGNVQVGVFSSLIFSTLLLGMLGYAAARRSGVSRRARWALILVSTLFGVVVIALKLFVLH